MRVRFRRAACRLAIFFLFLQGVVLCPFSAQAFKVGFFVLEPHAMLIDGQPGGCAVEYLRDHIASEMGAEFEFEGPLPFTRLLFDFKEGAYDAVLLLAKNSEREHQFMYPSEQFGHMESTLLVPKGFPLGGLRSPEDLNGLVVGYAKRAWRSPFMRHNSISFDLVTTVYATDTNFDKFDNYRLDAVYNPDKNALLYRLKRHSLKRPYKLIPVPGNRVGFYTVFHPSTPKQVMSRYEKALRVVQKKFPYENLVRKYIAQ